MSKGIARINEIITNEEELKPYEQEGLKDTKQLHELVQEETFEVVNTHRYNEFHTESVHKKMSSQPRPSTVTGYSLEIKLEVNPERDIPINTLTFKGYSPVQTGERIRALIPNIKKLEINKDLLPESGSTTLGATSHKRIRYASRSYEEQEKAIHIAEVTDGEQLIDPSFAVDYNVYMRYADE